MMRSAMALLLALVISACSLSPERRLAVDEAVESHAGTVATSWPSAGRIENSALERLLPDDGGHHVLLVEQGADALGVRVHLIRKARKHIELMNYIFYDDESGELLLAELIDAARRGVQVRILVDSLFSLEDARLLAAMELLDADIEVRLYNPLFDQARLGNAALLGATVCCLGELNHRLHHKLLSVDGRHGLVGGRNTADRYFDLDTRMNFLDMEVLVSGPVVADMVEDFDQFWSDQHTRPSRHTREVARLLLDAAPDEIVLEPNNRARYAVSLAEDAQWLDRFVERAGFNVSGVGYFADQPGRRKGGAMGEATATLHELIRQARSSVLIQTPYFVLSPELRRVFESVDDQVRLRVSTNSLAATDAWPVYAISRRQRIFMVDDLGIELYEAKPYPRDLVLFNRRYWRLVLDRASGFESAMRVDPPPAIVQMPGPRISLHAKIVIIDDEISVITSHNFDPRSENSNTENGVIIRDREVARALTEYVERLMAPGNSWRVAPRPNGLPVIGALNRAMGRFSRRLPTLDLWPWYLTANYETGASDAVHHSSDEAEIQPIPRDVGINPEVERLQRLLSTSLVSRMLGFLWPLM